MLGGRKAQFLANSFVFILEELTFDHNWFHRETAAAAPCPDWTWLRRNFGCTCPACCYRPSVLASWRAHYSQALQHFKQQTKGSIFKSPRAQTSPSSHFCYPSHGRRIGIVSLIWLTIARMKECQVWSQDGPCGSRTLRWIPRAPHPTFTPGISPSLCMWVETLSMMGYRSHIMFPHMAMGFHRC